MKYVAAFAAVFFTATAARADDSDSWFAQDKAKHFVASSSIGGGAYALAAPFSESVAVRAAFGAGVGITAGIGKEILDTTGFGTPSFRDLTWDAIGVAFGVTVAITIDLALHKPTRSVAY